jgi:hypothetical protein
MHRLFRSSVRDEQQAIVSLVQAIDVGKVFLASRYGSAGSRHVSPLGRELVSALGARTRCARDTRYKVSIFVDYPIISGKEHSKFLPNNKHPLRRNGVISSHQHRACALSLLQVLIMTYHHLSMSEFASTWECSRA